MIFPLPHVSSPISSSSLCHTSPFVSIIWPEHVNFTDAMRAPFAPAIFLLPFIRYARRDTEYAHCTHYNDFVPVNLNGFQDVCSAHSPLPPAAQTTINKIKHSEKMFSHSKRRSQSEFTVSHGTLRLLLYEAEGCAWARLHNESEKPWTVNERSKRTTATARGGENR